MKFFALLVVFVTCISSRVALSEEISEVQKILYSLESMDLENAYELDNAFRVAEPLAKGGDMEAQYLMGAIFEQAALLGTTKERYKKFKERPWGCLEYDPNFQLPTDWRQGLTNDLCWEKSTLWYEKAAIQGHPNAQYLVGVAYDIGRLRGVPRNSSIALTWYERAAEKNIPGAIYHLAAAFAEGRERELDYEKAMKLFVQAAALGDTHALIQIGRLYEEGKGVEVDFIRARNLYLEALERGATAIAFRLGAMYEDGRGGAVDYIEAAKWYEISLRIPLEYDYKKIHELRKKLTRAERQESIKRADEWFEKLVNYEFRYPLAP